MADKYSELQELLSNMAGGGSRKPPRGTEFNMRVDFVAENATSEKMALSDLPKPARNLLDDLASRVLDIDNNFTVVVGSPHAGKTFFIEQLAHNIDEYLAPLKRGKMIFVSLHDITMIELGNTANLSVMSQHLCQNLGAEPQEICLVTESPETALYLATVLPQHKILLEINNDTFSAIINNATRSTSKNWRSWNIIDVDEVECSREELSQLLYASVVKRLNDKYQRSLTKRQLNSFISFSLKHMEGNEHEHDNGPVIATPPGIWATAVRALMANYVYASDPELFRADGAINFRRVMEKTLMEYISIFGGPPQEDEDDEALSGLIDMGLPEELADLIRSGGGRIVATSAAVKQGETKESTPLEFGDLSTLEKRLSESVMGQEDAVSRVATSFLVPAAGLSDPKKPVRSFLFLGPTGVGKTALTMELAQQVSKEPMHVVRIDMSEYQQPHEVAKLFGAPPGYMGFEKGGILTNAVAENPHSVVLLDEIEKADAKILDSFLQVLDAGHMTDAQGNTIDFTQTIVVMTSNIGAREASAKRSGFAAPGAVPHTEKVKKDTELVLKELEKILRPEFVNRIDDVIVFQHITKETARRITLREIDILAQRMKAKGYNLATPAEDVVDNLLLQADIEKYGAREIQRVVFKNVAKPLAEKIVQSTGLHDFSLAEDNNAISITGA